MSGRSAAEIIITGRVQGVGYRNYAQRRAHRLGLDGYVMNLKDGRVRARAEGPRQVIEEFRGVEHRLELFAEARGG